MCTPVALFVYKRFDHTRETIENLAGNVLAKDTDLIVFADGPADPAVAGEVAVVRDYLKTVQGFKSVRIVERDTNYGLARSIIQGVTEVCEQYGRVIVVEDDIVTSPHFLTFMNDALDYYAPYETVWSVSGYTPALAMLHDVDPHRVFFHYRASSWGWGTWWSRWQKAQWDRPDYDQVLHDPHLRQLFDRGGDDLSRMLQRYLTGQNHSWLIRWYYESYLRGAVTLFPARSLVKNLGLDGTGTNFTSRSVKVLQRYDTELDASAESFAHTLPVHVDPRFHKAMFLFWSVPFYHRVPALRGVLRLARRILRKG